MLKGLGRGCLIGLGIIIVISVLGALFGGNKGATSSPAATVLGKTTAPPTQPQAPEPPPLPTLTPIAQPTDAPAAPVPTAAPAADATPAPAAPAVAPGSDSYPCAVGQLKGNRDSKIYHAPGGASYARTQENVACFDTAAEAEAAGYRAAKN